MFHLMRYALIALLLIMGQGAFAQADEEVVVDVELPALNAAVQQFALASEGKKVGRGECWDLAAEALNLAGAKWDGMYAYGKVVDWKKNEVMPGDIVQMENVEVEHRSADMIMRERYGHHTAVVVAVKERGFFTLAHQNVEPVGKKVGFSDLQMSNVRGGKLTFYRPVN